MKNESGRARKGDHEGFSARRGSSRGDADEIEFEAVVEVAVGCP